MKNKLCAIAASLLIMLFVYAGLSKLMDYSTFRFQLGRSPYVTGIAGFVAWFMPAAELIAALLLTFQRTRLFGFYLSFLLMVLFTGYIYAMLHYSPFLPCSCGGVLSAMSWEQHLYFNIFFVLVALAGTLLMARDQEIKFQTA
ncbi:MAG TPA: MauE/DoxX family redox-associated membrane protein [Sphingobacteriaceae bacterium]